MHDDDSEDQTESEKKVTEICEAAIQMCHKRVHQTDKKNPMTISELKEIMFIVREAHYLTNDFDGELLLGDLNGNIRSMNDEDEEEAEDDETEFEDEDEDEEDDKPGPFRF